MFSSRNLDSDKKLAAELGSNARAGTPQEAAAFGQVILFAVPYSAFPELTKGLGSSLKGKVVINASNPFPERDGDIASKARAEGAGRFDADMLPGALVIRAFNAVGAARMASAHEDPGKIGMPIAGDKQAIEIASRLVREAGFEPVVVGRSGDGQVSNARYAARGGAYGRRAAQPRSNTQALTVRPLDKAIDDSCSSDGIGGVGYIGLCPPRERRVRPALTEACLS